MLIDKYSGMENPEHIELLSQLPENYQEALIISYYQDGQEPYVALWMDEQEFLPSNPEYRCILDRLTEIVIEEWRQRSVDGLVETLDAIKSIRMNINGYHGDAIIRDKATDMAKKLKQWGLLYGGGKP